MKKRLLTVLLAVVMVFGVFGLTACGAGANPADEYNYFTSVYSSLSDVEADDVRIEQLTFNGLYKMAQTPGNFIVYWGGAYDSTAKANIKKAQQLAEEYDITIYNFDPCLDGQAGLDSAGGKYNVASADITSATIGDVSVQMASLQAELMKVLAIGNVRQFPSQGSLVYIKGGAPTVEASDIAAAGYKVSYNGSLVKSSNKTDMFEFIIQMACFKLPNPLASADSNGNLPSSAFNSITVNEFNIYNDYRLHMAGDYASATSDYIGENQSVFVTTTYHAMYDLLANSKGVYAIFVGGTWCHNSQAVAKYTSDLAKAYGISKIYMFDTRLDDGATGDSYELIKAQPGEYNYDAETGVITPAKDTVKVYADSTLSGDVRYLANMLNTRGDEGTNVGSMNYAHLYARLIDQYLPEYVSTVNAGTISIKGVKGTYSKVCTPTLLLIDGDKAAGSKIIGQVEAEFEYGWAPYQEAWEEAVKDLFDENPYASYQPPMVTEGESTESTDSSSDSSSSSDSGASALPPTGGGC